MFLFSDQKSGLWSYNCILFYFFFFFLWIRCGRARRLMPCVLEITLTDVIYKLKLLFSYWFYLRMSVFSLKLTFFRLTFFSGWLFFQVIFFLGKKVSWFFFGWLFFRRPGRRGEAGPALRGGGKGPYNGTGMGGDKIPPLSWGLENPAHGHYPNVLLLLAVHLKFATFKHAIDGGPSQGKGPRARDKGPRAWLFPSRVQPSICA